MNFTAGPNSRPAIIAANGGDSSNSAASTSDNATSTSRSIRVFTRRYKLTHGGYKYLEIGIKASPPGCPVEIALGDNRGNEIVFDVENWLRFIELGHVFSSIFANPMSQQRPDLTNIASRAGNLMLKIDKFGNRRVFCIQSPDVRITMTYPTVQYMFVLAPCVARTVESLSNMANSVSASLAQMRAVAAAAPNAASIPQMIRGSTFFRSDSAIDCELLAVLYERNAIPNDVY